MINGLCIYKYEDFKFKEVDMKPYKLHSLVRRKGSKTILMIIDRRLYRVRSIVMPTSYIKYTLIEPHKPDYQTTAKHDELVPLVSS